MLLKDCTLLTLFPSSVEHANIRVQGGSIVACGPNLVPIPEEEIVDLAAAFVMPGMVNAHTHLYSALSRGMPPPPEPPGNFIDILKKIWWRLDESLDEESIYYSALAGAVEALKFGTTTLIDHHASPNAIRGSLDIIKQALSDVGIRGILCYETTDRGGRKRRDAGLEENKRFVTANAGNATFRGMIGAHASFTLTDDSMRLLGELTAALDSGVHIHVAEDKADVEDSMRKHGIDVVTRLREYGMLSAKSVLAHGVHLSGEQIAAVNDSGAWLIHNPRSNMNNAVGYAPIQLFGQHSAIGTDGFPADMFDETRTGFFKNRESAHQVPFTRLPLMLQTGQALASQYFRREFGTFNVGAPADLVVMEYQPPTPITADNLLGHFLFGMASGNVTSVMVNGAWRVWNRALVGMDEEKVMSEAARAAKELWQRMTK